MIVIDDGSRDATGQLLEELKKKHSRLKVITHHNNRGYGGALKSGFANAVYDYVFFTDGDGQFDMREFGKLASLIENCDIAAGIRVKRQDNIFRIVNAKLYNLLVRLLFALKARDIDCAFKLIKKKVIDSLNLHSDSQFISAELLIKAKRKGSVIKQVGVNHLPREKGKATGNNPLVVIRAFKELFRLWKELKTE